MAITLTSSPSDVQSVGMPILFRVTSDSTDVTTEIQCKIYYRKNSSEFFKLAATKQRTKEIGKDYFEFNVSSILESVLESYLAITSTGLDTGITSACEYSLYFAEYYPSTLPVIHDTLTTSSFYATNTKLYHTETQNVGTGSDWYMDAAGTHKFLTDSPSIVPIRSSERIQLGFLTDKTDPTIVVTETKVNLSTASVEYDIANKSYYRYLWDWAIDRDKVVSFLPIYPSQTSAYKSGESGTVGLQYMSDSSNKLWGGLTMTSNNSTYDFFTPDGISKINIGYKSSGANTEFEIYYKVSGTWTLSSGSMPITATSTFQLYDEIPVLSPITEVRIKKVLSAGVLQIPYIYLTTESDNVVNKRCVFTLDTTHIDSDTKEISIVAKTATGGSVMSETKTFLVDKEALYQNTTRFAVRNKRGDFDHFTYTQLHSEVLSAEKTRFTRELPNSYTLRDRGRGVIRVNSEKVFSCVSKYIEEADLQWWATIIESPEVYVIENDVPIAVDILTDSVPTYAPDVLIQLKIDWTYAVRR